MCVCSSSSSRYLFRLYLLQYDQYRAHVAAEPRGGRATGATLALKVLRYQNVPKMAPGAAAPCAAPVVAGDKQRLLDSMQGIKVMIKEAKQVLSI